MKRLSRVVQSLVILREVFLVGRRIWIECTPSLLQSRDIVQDGLSLCGQLFVLSRPAVGLLILNPLDRRLVACGLCEPFEQILCECHYAAPNPPVLSVAPLTAAGAFLNSEEKSPPGTNAEAIDDILLKISFNCAACCCWIVFASLNAPSCADTPAASKLEPLAPRALAACPVNPETMLSYSVRT